MWINCLLCWERHNILWVSLCVCVTAPLHIYTPALVCVGAYVCHGVFLCAAASCHVSEALGAEIDCFCRLTWFHGTRFSGWACTLLFCCFLQQIYSSSGNADLASPAAQTPDGCSERELLWSHHIPGWIRTGNRSRNRIWPSLLSRSNHCRSVLNTSSTLPSPISLTLFYVGDGEALWKSRRGFLRLTFRSCPASRLEG